MTLPSPAEEARWLGIPGQGRAVPDHEVRHPSAPRHWHRAATPDSTHEIAQAAAPESRVVYVDNDPLVLVHARPLLTSTPQGACDYVEADVHNIAAVLAGARWMLDFTRPAAVLLLVASASGLEQRREP